ncbi:MAG TPA: hypothetical protein VMH28_15100 [Candidatus Acidoferrales bacterium]|nr:hypothetical protein [Candidatus Acidoferrales bacterium]
MRFVGHYWQSNAISGRLRLTGLVVALAAIALLIAVRDLRRLPGCRLLMWLLGIRFTLLTLIANPKFEHYIVHLVPFFAMAIGIAGSYLWRQAGIEAAAGSRSPLRGPRYRSICLVVLALYFASQTGVMVHRAFIIRGYQNEYLPLIAYLKAIARPSDLIVGSSELGFGLGFYNPHLADDVWLGYWSGRHPSVVVVDRWYYGGVFEGATVRHLPAPNYFGSDFKRHYYMVKVIGGYRVYRRYDGG